MMKNKLTVDNVRESKIPVLAYIDNKSSDESLRSTKQVQEKRLRKTLLKYSACWSQKRLMKSTGFPAKRI